MVFLLSQQQNTATRNTSDPTAQIMPIMTATPSTPNTVNGFDGCGSGGGTGQLASQSTQLQAGTSGWKNNTYSQQKTFHSLQLSWQLNVVKSFQIMNHVSME
jgi:hypothetical protein